MWESWGLSAIKAATQFCGDSKACYDAFDEAEKAHCTGTA